MGFILYKLLLGLVLPIALIVSLAHVLKFLLKEQSDSVQDVSQTFPSSDPDSSFKKIVEIKPVEEDKSVEEDKPD